MRTALAGGLRRWLLALLLAVAPAIVVVGVAGAQQWDDMSAKERGEARRNYERFQKMPPETRQKVERNYDRWQKLPPNEKERLRSNYQEYQDLPRNERRRLQRDE